MPTGIRTLAEDRFSAAAQAGWKRRRSTLYDDWRRSRREDRVPRTAGSLVSALGSPSPGDSGAFAASHPSAGQLEATAFGRLAEAEARAVRAHAAACAICGPVLQREERTYQRLAVLRGHEPTIHVVERVLDRLDHAVPKQRTARLARPAFMAACVLAGALVVAGAAGWRALRARLARA